MKLISNVFYIILICNFSLSALADNYYTTAIKGKLDKVVDGVACQ